ILRQSSKIWSAMAPFALFKMSLSLRASWRVFGQKTGSTTRRKWRVPSFKHGGGATRRQLDLMKHLL
ncbi:hypothetical protein OAR53_06700, partial [Luminiphilus sp.]|nr:hypothetical protein [Luminiphilus sp.]